MALTNFDLCIYHANCADGFGAAWAVHKAIPTIDFYGASYQQDPPDVIGLSVIMVDFSYNRPVLLEMASKATSILILDHHQSAQEDLVELPSNVTAVFDMTRSGAMLAWNYFFPASFPPQLIEHIQDRDLWQFHLPGTREIQANLFSYPYDFKAWDILMAAEAKSLIAEGAAIERKHHKDIAELLKIMQQRMIIAGFDVPVANLPYTYSSDAGHIMAQGEPFAACYWDTLKGRIFSLRSTEKGEDVANIAKQYGGGGHKHAAGFTVPYGHPLTQPAKEHSKHEPAFKPADLRQGN